MPCRSSQARQVVQQSDEHPGQTELKSRPRESERRRAVGVYRSKKIQLSPQSSQVCHTDPIRVLQGFGNMKP